jgi:hypothetical protein
MAPNAKTAIAMAENHTASLAFAGRPLVCGVNCIEHL